MTALATLTPGQRATTTSLVVAEKFGKQHKDVLRAIRNLECSTMFNERNFAPVEYVDPKGEKRPMYEMTKDGFMFLAMGFTGPEAAQWKEKFIDAFNALETAWQSLPLARLALHEAGVRRRAEALPLMQQAYVSGLLQGGRNLYETALDYAERYVANPPPVPANPPRPIHTPSHIKRHLKPAQREAILRDLASARSSDSEDGILIAHAQRLKVSVKRLKGLLAQR